MEYSEFQTEMDRLRTQWPNAYGSEREALIFRAFRTADLNRFHECVSSLLVNCKGVPLLEDFCREFSKLSISNNSGRGGPSDPFGILNRAARHTQANGEFVKACLKVVSDKNSGRLNLEQFHQACDWLDATAKELNPETCSKCNDTGYNFRRDKKYHMFLYRCNCAVGRARSSHAVGKEAIEIPFAPNQTEFSGRERATGKDT